jgi:hypothetical protein
MSFLNLRIRGRLYSGFGVLTLITVALAGFAVWQLWSIRSQVDTLTMQSKGAVRAGQIATELQGIRRGLLRYAFDQDEASFTESDKRLTAITGLLEEAARATTSEERRAAYVAANKELAELKTKLAVFGDAIKQMVAGRNLMFSDGDKLTADVRKFEEVADKTTFAAGASALEAKLLLVRGAAWRMLATRDARGLETFKINLGKTQEQIAELERADLPSNLLVLLASIRAGLGKYAEAFEKAGPESRARG